MEIKKYPKIKVKKVITEENITYKLSFKNSWIDRNTIHINGYKIIEIKKEGFEDTYEELDFISLDFDLRTGECFDPDNDYRKWFIDFIRKEVLKIKKEIKR